MTTKLWCEMTRKERRAFKKKRRPLTQDQHCARGNHVWRPWEWTGLWSERNCENCGHDEWPVHQDDWKKLKT